MRKDGRDRRRDDKEDMKGGRRSTRGHRIDFPSAHGRSRQHSDDSPNENEAKTPTRHVYCFQKKHSEDDVTLEDFEDDFEVDSLETPARSRQLRKPGARDGFAGKAAAISGEEARALRLLLLGDESRRMAPSWLHQGFFFRGESNERNARTDKLRWPEAPDLGYGLVQVEGGPCGPIAVVQAELLRYLICEENCENFWRNPEERKREDALVQALACILWRCRGGIGAKVCVRNSCPQFDTRSLGFEPDGLTERISVHHVTSLAALQDVFRDPDVLLQYRRPQGFGVSLFVMSAILSRGAVQVLRDMKGGLDSGNPRLIEAHNYATQELVNLLICGKAHSQVFDGVKTMGLGAKDAHDEVSIDIDCDEEVGDSFFNAYYGRGEGDNGKDSVDDDVVVLRGIPNQNPIGFLTLFEAYDYVEVGDYYKNPRNPIWVVCSESHYSVLFATSRSMGDIRELFFYDELAEQTEEIR